MEIKLTEWKLTHKEHRNKARNAISVYIRPTDADFFIFSFFECGEFFTREADEISIMHDEYNFHKSCEKIILEKDFKNIKLKNK